LNHSWLSPFTEEDCAFMRRALDLAQQGRLTVHPNPRVGCVVVRPAGKGEPSRILGEGYHRRQGMPHAEREALAACVEPPQGATAYVTLEPCCHHGATPPCTEALLQAGIARVVVAVADPFPQVRGKGIELLRQHGVQVDVGLLEEDARYLNRFFFHFHTRGLPWVILKAAVSLDGKLATRTGHSQWITGEEARAHAHEIRAEVQAILAGIQTVLADDPRLTPRPASLPEAGWHPPLRVVLDPELRIPYDAQLLKTVKRAPVRIYCSREVPETLAQALRGRGAEVERTGGTAHRLNLTEVLASLARSGVSGVLVEGGARIHTAFLEANLVNEVMVYVAPSLIGGKEAPTFYMGRGVDTIQQSMRLERLRRIHLGEDTLIQGILRWRL